MPLYEYRCEECGHEFEEWKSMSRRDEADCPECKSPKVRRLVRSFGFIAGAGRTAGSVACAPSSSGVG